MNEFALTPSGLSTQTQEQVFERLDAKMRSTLGVNTNTDLSSQFGQQINIISELGALYQQVTLGVYRSFNPNAATGVPLDERAALTGSTRDGATSSVVDGLLEFTSAGTMSDGDLIQNDDNNTQWKMINGPVVSAGPWPESLPATLEAVNTGATLAQAGTTWSLVTVVAGLDNFTNPSDDADPGRDQQGDPDFRIDRQIELYSANIGGLLAIRAVVSKVDGVETVRVYHNPNGPGPDPDGIPFKAFNVVVETAPSPPGLALQQAIGDAIFSALGAGGEAFGTDFNTTVTDTEGGVHTGIRFDLADEVDVFVSITLITTGTEQEISQNIVDVVRAAVLEGAQTNFSGIGQNQLAFEYEGIIAALQKSGQISGVTQINVNLSRVATIGPFADPLEIGIRERPSFESSSIVVALA